MKKFILGFITCSMLTIPYLAYSAPNLAEKLNGFILLAVEDHGKTYYVKDGIRYRMTKETALDIFRKLALGITNENLNEIPEGDVGIEPEIKVEKECAVVEEITKVVEVPALCDYTDYIDRINDLKSQLDNQYCPTCSKCEEETVGESEKEKEELSDMIIDVGVGKTENGHVLVNFINRQNLDRGIQIREIYVKNKEITRVGINIQNKSYLIKNVDYKNGIFRFKGTVSTWLPTPIKITAFIPETDEPAELEMLFDKWVIYDEVTNKRVRLRYQNEIINY